MEHEPAQGGTIAGDDSRIVPEGLDATAKPGGCGSLDLVALTLQRGELYAALKNAGAAPACSPVFSVELFDADQQFLATGLGGLLVQRFYRAADAAGSVVACVAPGDTTMVAITDLPSDIVVEDVAHVVYWCNYWAVDDAAALAGISITDVRAVTREEGVAYTGTLVNALEVALSGPSVAIFPLNRVGRPLGVALGVGVDEVLPGGSWQFETNTVHDAGVDRAAYPAHGP
jgi:hypothetical protein